VTSPMFEAEELIKQSIEKYGENVGVACSFGKDSLVVLHMALKYNWNIKVFFNNTGVEFPETIKFKEEITKLWNLNLIETKPYKNMTFWKCLDKYGLPTCRGGKKKLHTPKCCYYLKEKPTQIAYKEHKIKAIFTGITRWESRVRNLVFLKYENLRDDDINIGTCGQRYFSKSWGIWKIHPIINWKEEEVWDYIKRNNLPINPVYQKWNGVHRRVGCLPCTAYTTWEKVLSKSHPQIYRLLKRKQHPEQRELEVEARTNAVAVETTDGIPPKDKSLGILPNEL